MINSLEKLIHDWADSRGEGATVALIDSGVDSNHPDLKDANIETFRMEEALGEVSASPEEPRDVAGHGTACAARILCLAPRARIVSCRVLSSSMQSTSRLLLGALAWLLTRDDIDIVNLSLGTPNRAFGLEIAHAVDQFYARGIPVVASAGPAERPDYPAIFAGPVSVAAVACASDEDLLFRVNDLVEFAARGVDVEVPWSRGERITVSGSSFAAPLVAGRMARFKAMNRSLRVWELKSLLQHQAVKNCIRVD